MVLETAKAMRPLGVGINIQPNAVRELFALGVGVDLLDQVGLPVKKMMKSPLNTSIEETQKMRQKKLTPRYAKTATSVDSLSNLLNQGYIDPFSKDPTLKPNGFRKTLQAKFDAADTPNKTSGYLIGWKKQDTFGMQKDYNKQSYPHLQLLQFLKACYAVEE